MSGLDFTEDRFPRLRDIINQDGLTRSEVLALSGKVVEEMQAQDSDIGDALDRLSQKTLEHYTGTVDAGQKARTFFVLELLAGKSPQGHDVARSAITGLAQQGDERAREKTNRIVRSFLIG